MNFNRKLVVMFAVPTALALLGAAAYLGFFLYEMMASSVGRGGGSYAVQFPKTAPEQVKDAKVCSQKTSKWIGCF